MRNRIFTTFVANAIDRPLDGASIVYLTGDEVVAALFVLIDRFRGNLTQIRTVPYNPSFEKEADAAIEAEVLHNKEWAQLSAEAWRVMLERLVQAIMVAQLNQSAQNPLIPIPEDLPESAWTGAAMIFLMYGMKLPFPIGDRSDFSWPANALPGSVTRQ